jgi:hypothetical protein
MAIVDGTKGDPILIKAKEFGFQGMFHTPAGYEDCKYWLDNMISGIPSDSQAHVYIIAQGVANMYAIKLAKLTIELEKRT